MANNGYIHYILVRRDLPFGITLAMVAHAAAESNNGDHFVVAVLGVRNEHQLGKWHEKLTLLDIAHVDIVEPDPPWHGALMSIGVFPDKRDDISHIFSDLSAYYEYEGPRPTTSRSDIDIASQVDGIVGL